MGSENSVQDAEPEIVNGLRVPDQAALLRGTPIGTLATSMGVRFVELSAERAVAVMPVARNTQPFGLLHGGASAALGETLGSFAANLHAGPGRYAVGVDLNATHTGSAKTGWVTGTCTAIHLGGSTAVHEIVVTDADGRRLSTIRITNYLRDAR